MLEQDTVPCKICVGPTKMLGTQLCDGCWEAQRGIRYLLNLPDNKGRDYLKNEFNLACEWDW